jgi:TRAP-type C4-dicarboxylate transport system permease small subunit
MPLGDLAEPIVQIIWQFVAEVLVKGAGYIIIKYGWYLGRRASNIDGIATVVVGFAFWAAVVVGSLWLCRHVGSPHHVAI